VLQLPSGYSLELCARVAAWRYEDLPPRVVRQLKLLLVDSLAVIAGAARAPGIPELNARLARWEPGGSATGLIGKRRYSPPSAALANGAAAHALDYDDIHDAARVHSTCVVLPALLAAAQDAGPVDGRQLLLGLAVGAELHARLGLACYNSLAAGWHPTTLFGSLAASIAAGRLLNLNTEKLRNALGIAFHQAGGSVQSAYDGVISKRLGPGFAARDAVISAFLAADGLTGTREPLEGRAGFFVLHARGEAKPELLTEGLGSTWRIEEYSLKPYPACRCSHAAIGLAVKLHDEGLAPEAVGEVEIRMSEANWKLVGKPYDASLDSVVHAQFNAAYSFARALSDGSVGLKSYERPAITQTAVVNLARRVRVVIDPAIDKDAMDPVAIHVGLRGGGNLTRTGTTPKGMTDREMLDKLRGCLEFGGYAPSTAERLLELASGLEGERDAAAALVDAFP
jgi:2-methylcitrate dehydratase PrpD